MKILIFLFAFALFHILKAAKVPKPVTVKTEIDVRDTENQKVHFLHVKNSRDGKPIGIIVKKKDRIKKTLSKQSKSLSEEIQEIIGVRVPDDEEDAIKVYRNAKIINNTLVTFSKR